MFLLSNVDNIMMNHKNYNFLACDWFKNAGFSLTFEVEGHWLVSRQVLCKTEGRRPEPLGGFGGMLPRKFFRT